MVKPTFISLFTGIGGFDLGLERAGWECIAQCDNDPFCNKVLAKHWPEVMRYDDVRLITGIDSCSYHAELSGEPASFQYLARRHFERRGESNDGIQRRSRPDLICGGFPCQDLSVAGKRAGLGGARSGLWFEFHRILSELRPTFALIENVPGLLSSNQGRDFGVVISGLGELWPAVGWAVLDSQHFGVAQRRRRVYVIAGPSRECVQQILSLCEGGDWHPAKGRAPGEDVAYTLSAGVRGTGDGHGNAWNSNYRVANTLPGHHPRHDLDNDTYIPSVGHQVQTKHRSDFESETLITHTLSADGFDASEDGTGRGTPLVAMPLRANRWGGSDSHGDQGNVVLNTMPVARYNEGDASAQETHARTLLSALRQAVGEEAFAEWGLGILDSFQQAHLLRPDLHGRSFRREAGLGHRMGDDSLSRPQVDSARPVFALWRAGSNGYTPQGWQPSEQLARELNAHLSQLSQSGALAEAFLHGLWQASEGLGLLRQALSEVQEIWRPAASEAQSAQRVGVRRLTPTETERLQGFPDSWTCICGADGNLAACRCPDGPRYKACGNAVTVPVIEYIGTRIREVLA